MSNSIYIHYALQTCDTASRASSNRYVPATKSEITKKCVTSFLESVTHAAKLNPNGIHVVRIFDDHSTNATVKFLTSACRHYTKNNVTVELELLTTTGLVNSLKSCYEFLRAHGKHVVYQVQDDYLFTTSGVYEMIDTFFKVNNEAKTNPVILSFNHPYYWKEVYTYQSTPRTVVAGCNRYWIQIYECGCSFLTSIDQFNQHWDLYQTCFDIINKNQRDVNIDVESFHKIFKRNVLGLAPMTSVALHLHEYEFDADPYVDWKPIWDSIKDII